MKLTHILAAIAGVLAVVLIVLLVGYESPRSSAVHPSPDFVPPPLGLSNFELGQYYFNHDDDPGGPYDLRLARYYFEAALSSDPKAHELAWYQLGRIDFIEGKFDAALDKFNTQIEYFGDDIPNVYYMIGLVYGYKARETNDESDWRKGEEAFLTFIEYKPTAPWSRVDLAWIYFAQGKFEEMYTPLEQGLGYFSDNPWLLNMYGLALMNTGETTRAREVLTQAKKEAEKLTPADWGRAYSGNNPTDWPRGLREFQAAIDKNLELVQR